MEPEDFFKAVIRAVVLYATDGDGYERHMDYINTHCSDEQWDALDGYLALADEAMVDGGVASVEVVERTYARREERDSRAPGQLFTGSDYERDKIIEYLKGEYKARRIPFKDSEQELASKLAEAQAAIEQVRQALES